MSAAPAPARIGSQPRVHDRRAHGRYPVHLQLEYKLWLDERVARVGFGKTVNMSSRGILLETDADLPTGSSVTLAIMWPIMLEISVALKLHIRGRVVRCDASRIAV